MDSDASDSFPSKKRKGGQRQRLAASAAAAAPPNLESKLARYLKAQWSWGHLSPQDLQRIAAFAVDDMRHMTGDAVIPPELMQLARMGSHGVHPNNMHRDLLHLMKDESLLPEPLMTRFPMKTEALTMRKRIIQY